MKRLTEGILIDVLLGVVVTGLMAIAVVVVFSNRPYELPQIQIAQPQVTEARFLFPPLCQKRPWENATVCIAWDPYLHEFTEVKRVPLNPAGPLPGAAALRPVGPRS